MNRWPIPTAIIIVLVFVFIKVIYVDFKIDQLRSDCKEVNSLTIDTFRLLNNKIINLSDALGYQYISESTETHEARYIKKYELKNVMWGRPDPNCPINWNCAILENTNNSIWSDK